MENAGIVLTLDRLGRVLSVERNYSGMDDKHFIGKLIVDLFSKEDVPSVLEFLAQINFGGTSFSKSFTLEDGKRRTRFYFSAVKFHGLTLALGSTQQLEFEDLISQLMSINNDQTNMLRKLFKDQSIVEDKREREIETSLYEELSRVNNDLVNIQRELVKKNFELKTVNKLKNQFLGVVAHDLRNPLGGIMNLAEIVLEDEENLSEGSTVFLTKIVSLSKSMLNLVSDLLDFSSIESGNINLNKIDVDLVKLVKESISLNKPLAEKKNIKITLSTTKESLIINGDINKLDQVVTNLLTNAIKYSHANTLTEVTIFKGGDFIQLIIKDQGQGIPQEELKNLFKPFSKTSVRATANEKSTGLGLLIVQKIVKAHGGDITVESTVGMGTTFSVKLPV